jgi:hypothetical protein
MPAFNYKTDRRLILSTFSPCEPRQRRLPASRRLPRRPVLLHFAAESRPLETARALLKRAVICLAETGYDNVAAPHERSC